MTQRVASDARGDCSGDCSSLFDSDDFDKIDEQKASWPSEQVACDSALEIAQSTYKSLCEARRSAAHCLAVESRALSQAEDKCRNAAGKLWLLRDSCDRLCRNVFDADSTDPEDRFFFVDF